MIEKKRSIKKSTAQAICDAVKVKEGTTEGVPFNEVAKRVLALPTASGENKFAQLISGTLTEITAEDLEGITQIRSYTFYKLSQIVNVELPNSITYIGDSAFYECYALTNLTLSPNITNIGVSAFNNTNLRSDIILPDGITVLNSSIFKFCTYLPSVILPKALEQIKDSTFEACVYLKELTIPATVTSIGRYALQCGGSHDATITFLGTTPPSIQSNTFATSRLNKIIVPKGCGEAYKTATNWANFADYIEEATE
jgi:hypothetical protein